MPCLALPCLAIHLRPFQKFCHVENIWIVPDLTDFWIGCCSTRTHFISRGKAIATVTTTSYALTVALKHAQHKPDSKSTMISPCPSTEGQARPLWSLPFEHAGTTSPKGMLREQRRLMPVDTDTTVKLHVETALPDGTKSGCPHFFL